MPSESLWLETIVILLLILANGFFSGSEIAIISARRSKIEEFSKKGMHSADIVKQLKDDPDRFLATVQVGITIIGSLASVIGGVAAIEILKPLFMSIQIEVIRKLAEPISVGIVVIAISYATLIFGELIPKSLALRYAEELALISARPIDWLSRAASIFVKLLTKSSNLVMKLFGAKGLEERAFISEEEIKYFIKEGKEKGIFEETEEALIHGVFEFADTTVKEIMVPKHKFNAIDIDTQPEQILQFIVESGFSRYPVYRDATENIIGILYNKDVFKVMEEKKPLVLRELIRPPYFVPDTVMISRLLRELQRRRIHMAIVVNEHGEVDGLVTIEDILEEIVGEIEDEYDIEKGGLVERLKDGTMIIDASSQIRDLIDVGLPLEGTEELNTLAGFMYSKLQKIPRGGEFVFYKGYRFTVVDVEGRRIVKVKAEKVSAPSASPTLSSTR
ncbi:MAG: HlyC/CorC family transporter [Deltaproteobacteria bacterium]|nr:HlyC/CorC family transporter [Deltaproteobacteria bacterium]